MEEEHRRILREVCLAPVQKVPLIDFLRNPENAASTTVELNLERSREIESRPLDFLMPFLHDMNILSELRKGARCDRNGLAVGRKRKHPGSLHLRAFAR